MSFTGHGGLGLPVAEVMLVSLALGQQVPPGHKLKGGVAKLPLGPGQETVTWALGCTFVFAEPRPFPGVTPSAASQPPLGKLTFLLQPTCRGLLWLPEAKV